MIFVTVGTHEQQFDRLVKAVDALKRDGLIEDQIFIQTGYSIYEPTFCDHARFLSYTEMRSYFVEADVIITHGGPSSFIEAIIAGKQPVVVPRKEEFGEHVNNHQEDFVRIVAERQGGIIPVYDIADLLSSINRARSFMDVPTFMSHNAKFCEELNRLIEGL